MCSAARAFLLGLSAPDGVPEVAGGKTSSLVSGGGLYSFELHLHKLVATAETPAGPLSLGEEQPCPAPRALRDFGMAQGCKRICQERGWGAGRVFQFARHQHPTFSVLVSHQDKR